MINEDKIREVWASNPERGFKLLIDFFQQPIYWHIRRLVVSHEDAEDILQEVFIRVFRHLPQFREESSLGTWIYRIATNECLRFLNMRKEQAVSAEEVQEELMNKLMASDYVDYENEMAVKFQQAILLLQACFQPFEQTQLIEIENSEKEEEDWPIKLQNPIRVYDIST